MKKLMTEIIAILLISICIVIIGVILQIAAYNALTNGETISGADACTYCQTILALVQLASLIVIDNSKHDK